MICQRLFPTLDNRTIEQAVQFVDALDTDIVQHRRFGAQGGPWEFNLRDTTRWLSLVQGNGLLSAGNAQDFVNLLFTQRFATLGAVLALPILTAITVFCWSTHVYPTATIATLMWLGTLGLVMWDFHKWRGVFARDDRPHDLRIERLVAGRTEYLWKVLRLDPAQQHVGVGHR